MAHQQDENQAARKQAGQDAAHEPKTPEGSPRRWPHADQWPNYTPQAETDNEFPEDPAASRSPSFTPQARTDNEFPEEEKTDVGQPPPGGGVSAPPGTISGAPGRSEGTGQGRTDQGGEGRLNK